jgi:hypothetical protein
MADLESGDMPLDQKLENMGLDPKNYKEYGGLHITNYTRTDGVVGYTRVKKKSKSAGKPTNPRPARKQTDNGKKCKIHRTT